MGIPSYFSHIIKHYSNIIGNFLDYTSNSTDHFFLDCNSIIYDSYYFLENNMDEHTVFDKTIFENHLIETVIEKIKKYIDMVRPITTVYIAFDGVAPFAKMDQQRTRRYKSHHMTTKSLSKIVWNTSLITPGTEFMNTLSSRVEEAFSKKYDAHSTYTTFVSTTNENGEGEHKIFHHIRSSNISKNDTIVVYGLDSDLIMLSIFHLKLCKNLYILREAPAFGVEYSDRKNDFNMLDIRLFSVSIVKELGCKCPNIQRIYDYAFMCFFLGNDFLPHFPALNIRTHGIQVLLDMYRMYIGKYEDRYFISPETNKIQWRWVRLFIGEIAKRERELLLREYFVRDKWDTKKWLENTEKEKEDILVNIPVIYRGEEKYICPEEPFWENRYYRVLFSEESTTQKKDICVNYLEGLEWVFKYYTMDCPDWKWKYNYHYPPLFTDLYHSVSHRQVEYFTQKKNQDAFSKRTQLSYVLPLGKMELQLFDDSMREHVEKNKELYPSQKVSYKWSFCRYFWESHILLPDIPLSLLEKWEEENSL